MADALSVARYFLWLAASEPEEELVTHMRLQKLLYYAQGWCLASRGEPLFEGTIEAWQHGPVVREVYPKFADYRGGPIPPSEACEAKELSGGDRRLLEWLWGNYGRFSAAELRRRTHAEPPWKTARGMLPEDEPSREPIATESMRAHFLEEYRTRIKREGLDPEQFLAALDDAREGRTVPLKDLMKELELGVAH
jgi:uncharacterized phage-associated protein